MKKYGASIIGCGVLAAALVGAATAHLALTDDSSSTEFSDVRIGAGSYMAGIDRSAIDPSVAACDNFYRHACGGFIAATKISTTRPVVSLAGRQFDASLDRNLQRLFSQDASDNTELGRLETFYTSCMAPDPAGVLTVEHWLARIDTAKTPDDMQTLIRDMTAIGAGPFFTYSGRPDRADWKRYRGEIHNSRLWADPAVIQRTFVLAGLSPQQAQHDAKSVAVITRELREHLVNRYDASKAENPRTLTQLEALAPAVDWPHYFAMVGAPPARPINVTSPAYLEAVNRQLTNRSPAELRAFFRWSFLLSLRGELPVRFSRSFGDIPPYLRVLVNDPAGRCREATIRAMGVEFSRQYAEHILGWKARDAARHIAENIKREIIRSIRDDRWLSPQARRSTAAKLDRTDLKIGFPDNWPAVGDYPLRHDHFLDNVLAARKFETQREWRRAGEARSPRNWEMMVDPWVGEGMAAARLVIPNGYPDAFSNSLIMTAAFLAPPRFDESAAPELNYATFGTMFAHEFVHVAENHMFGPDGQNAELWSHADIESAAKRDMCVIGQADSYEPIPRLKLSGTLLFDENVADYGGLRLAYQALAANMGARINRADSTGMTPAQRFFYKFAQNWCTAQTDDDLRKSVAIDGHAPPSFRVNAPLSNLPAFGQAFGCKAGARMIRSQANQCRVW